MKNKENKWSWQESAWKRFLIRTKYYLITKIRRKYIHKIYMERYNTLHGLIRIVIDFDEKRSAAVATIRYRELIIAELDEDEVRDAADMLTNLRRLNRHNNNI